MSVLDMSSWRNMKKYQYFLVKKAEVPETDFLKAGTWSIYMGLVKEEYLITLRYFFIITP